jgi:hypothetical protein
MKIPKLLLVVLCATIMTACDQVGDETDHRIVIPASAKNIQNRGNSKVNLLDRGFATMLEIDRKDLDGFVAQLKVTERRKPALDTGDPTVNGWNVWPKGAMTFVPGNEVFGGFKKTWDAVPKPEEMLSCQSPTGQSLHVEVWGLQEGRVLLKLFTWWE